MLNETTKWMLTHLDTVDPQKIALVTKSSEQECWEYLSDLDAALNEYAAAREAYLPTLQKELEDWIGTIPDRKETRRKVLLEKLQNAKKDPSKYDVPKLMREYKILTQKEGVITEAQIQHAREYPLENLIDHRKFMAKCPFHPDKTASMYLKNNFYHCFGCQANGDTIDFVMKSKNLTFPEAVRYLAG